MTGSEKEAKVGQDIKKKVANLKATIRVELFAKHRCQTSKCGIMSFEIGLHTHAPPPPHAKLNHFRQTLFFTL